MVSFVVVVGWMEDGEGILIEDVTVFTAEAPTFLREFCVVGNGNGRWSPFNLNDTYPCLHFLHSALLLPSMGGGDLLEYFNRIRWWMLVLGIFLFWSFTLS